MPEHPANQNSVTQKHISECAVDLQAVGADADRRSEKAEILKAFEGQGIHQKSGLRQRVWARQQQTPGTCIGALCRAEEGLGWSEG